MADNGAKNDGFSLNRALAVMSKEFIQLKRDIMTLRMIVAIPIMQLLLFGYALNNDPHNLPAAVLAQDHGFFARAVIAAMKNTDYFAITEAPSEAAARHLLQTGQAQFVITIPENFTRDLVRGDRPQLLVAADATDPVATSGALASTAGVLEHVSKQELKGPLADLRQQQPSPVDIVLHKQFNPEGFTRYNIVPGLIAIILTMTGIMMTALAITKERERGTMENLLAMPCKPLEVMMGKITPYVIIGYVQSFIIILVAKFLFHIPILGSLWLLAGALFIFITCNMAWGFSLSATAQNQTQALQMSMMVTLPSIMLSGFLFPFRGMPLWAQAIGFAMPATHFISISRGILLKGANIAEIWPHVWPMLLFMVFITLLAMKRYRRTLD